MYLENSGCVHVMAETALSSHLLTHVGLSFLEEVFQQKCPLLKREVWKVTRHLATTALWVMKLTFEYICMKWVGRTETFLAVVSSFSTRKQITYGDHTITAKFGTAIAFFNTRHNSGTILHHCVQFRNGSLKHICEHLPTSWLRYCYFIRSMNRWGILIKAKLWTLHFIRLFMVQ